MRDRTAWVLPLPARPMRSRRRDKGDPASGGRRRPGGLSVTEETLQEDGLEIVGGFPPEGKKKRIDRRPASGAHGAEDAAWVESSFSVGKRAPEPGGGGGEPAQGAGPCLSGQRSHREDEQGEPDRLPRVRGGARF